MIADNLAISFAIDVLVERPKMLANAIVTTAGYRHELDSADPVAIAIRGAGLIVERPDAYRASARLLAAELFFAALELARRVRDEGSAN